MMVVIGFKINDCIDVTDLEIQTSELDKTDELFKHCMFFVKNFITQS